MASQLVSLALALSLALGYQAQAQALSYLNAVLDQPPYRTAFDKMLKGQKVADWVRTFRATKNAVASPGDNVSVGGVPYEEYDVCKPHDCGGNFLFVVFTPGGRQAWGLFIEEGRTVRYYGNPNGTVRQALDKAAALQR